MGSFYNHPPLSNKEKACKLRATIKFRGRTMREKKQTSTFSKITKIVIWTMLILTVGSVVLTAVMSVM